MKTLKKSLAVMLTVLMLISATPLAGFVGYEWPEFKAEAASVSGGYLTSGYCGDPAEGDTKNIYWELSDDGVLTVTGTGKIAPEAFNYDLRVKKVIIGDGITNISDNCFNQCKNLTDISLGKDIVIIGKQAFSSCEKLASVALPDLVVTLETDAFRDCTALEKITLSKNLRTIENNVFTNCAA